MSADLRLIVLFGLAVLFMVGAIANSAPREADVDIQDSFIAFDAAEVFDLPILEEECVAEPSPLSRIQAL
ncbi:MAG: hypothetical protein QW165_04705 [Candidatus Woesearchaeota archaeon]